MKSPDLFYFQIPEYLLLEQARQRERPLGGGGISVYFISHGTFLYNHDNIPMYNMSFFSIAQELADIGNCGYQERFWWSNGLVS